MKNATLAVVGHAQGSRPSPLSERNGSQVNSGLHFGKADGPVNGDSSRGQ